MLKSIKAISGINSDSIIQIVLLLVVMPALKHADGNLHILLLSLSLLETCNMHAI